MRSLIFIGLSVVFAFQSFMSQTNSPCSSGVVVAPNLPLNTNCVITNGTTVGATAQTNASNGGLASCMFWGDEPDVWYSFVAPASGAVNITTYAGTITDGVMAVYSGTCGNFTELLCDDDGSGMPINTVSGLTPGETYFIRIWDYDSGTGTFGICVQELVVLAPPPCGSNPPAGEDCASATMICELNGYCGNTYNYGPDPWGNSIISSGIYSGFCGSIENDSYLKFVASSTTISFNFWVTTSVTNQGVQLMVFKPNNTCGSGSITSYYCQQIFPSPFSTLVTISGLTVGNTYYIMVDGYAGDDCDWVIGADSGIAIPVDVNPTSTTICSGSGTVNLTATGGNGTYTWNASPDLNTTTGANVVVTPPTTPGTYTYTVNSATGNPLCPSSTTATASIIVNDCGCAVTASNSGSVCPGGTFNLFATTVAGATSYTWSGPNGFTSSVQNPTNVPAINGTYTVDVVSATGNCSSSTTFSTYSLPVVSAGSPVSICPGGNTTLTASGAVSYVWDNTLGAGSSFAVTPPTSTTYTVVGTDANGCTNSASVLVTVNSLPTVSAGSDQSVCPGGQVTLSGSGASSYTWNNGVSNGVAFTPASTMTYTVTGTDANGCTNTDQVQVSIYTLPTVSAGTDQSVCPGGQVTLSGSGASSYSWNNGVSNGVAFTPASTMTYTVTGTDANGCTNTDQVQVTVNTLPVISASAAPNTICQGQSTVLTATGGTSYTWDNGLGAGNDLSASPSTTTTYNVIGTDANGCTNTASVSVTVNPNVPVDAGVDQSICIGDPVTLTATGTPTLSWDNGVSNGTAFTPSTTTTYTVTGTSANGCVTTDQVTVTVNALPNINAGVDQTICLGQSVTLSGSNGVSYTWDNGVSNGSPFAPGTTTTFTVTGTDANGCVNTDQLTVTVLPVPVANLSSDVTSGVVPLNVNFYNNSSNATIYNWYFGNGVSFAVNNTNDQNQTYNNPGTYEAILSVGNGYCSDEDTLYIIALPLAPPTIEVPNIFTPNGDQTNDHFIIETTNMASIEVLIMNRWGNVMTEYSGLNGYWDGTVNGKDADDGVYFYKYEAKGLNGDVLKGHGHVTLKR